MTLHRWCAIRTKKVQCDHVHGWLRTRQPAPLVRDSILLPRPQITVVQTWESWQSPLTRRYSRELSESGIRAVQCYDCPTAPCGSGHGTQVGQAKSETIKCSGNCHARRHRKVQPWSLSQRAWRGRSNRCCRQSRPPQNSFRALNMSLAPAFPGRAPACGVRGETGFGCKWWGATSHCQFVFVPASQV